jgi:putative transposase
LDPPLVSLKYMPEYRRSFLQGGSFFFTVVTYHRLPILTNLAARDLLHEALSHVQQKLSFEIVAICLLPDHIHCIWTLPEGDSDYSLRWKEVKRLFTQGYLAQIGPGEPRNASRQNHGEAAIWQRRFWEHMLRDQEDLGRHIDYIHFNPVKHGLVKEIEDWPWSSFHRYVTMGYYPKERMDGIDQKIREMTCGE